MEYCGRECQKEDWKSGHKHECQSLAFKTYDGLNLELKYQLFRIWARLKEPGLGDKPCLLYDGSTRTFNSLLSHANKHMDNPRLVIECQRIVSALSLEDPSVTLELFVNYFGTLQTNAFSILDEHESERIGTGVYIEPSVFNHSCKPTAFYWIHGTEMQVRAFGPIPHGEEPCISYIASHMDREERRKVLLERYNFECHCSKCEIQTDADIDYDNLNSNLTTLKDPVTMMQLSWNQMFEMHEKVVPLLEKIYHKYDDRITNQYKRMVDYALARQHQIPKGQLTQLIQETEHRLFITYGPDHPDYKEFKLSLPA